jgi:ubiquinone/menaquinone biosynthesis C-methylase UbiE
VAVATWEGIVKVTDTNGRKNIDLYKAIARDLGHDITAGSVILDFGCGEGQMVRQLRELGFEAYGADIVISGQNHFLRLIPNPYRIPFDDRTFDAVFSCSVLEHVKNLSEAVSEIHRVLKPGGFCLHFFPPKLRPIEDHIFVPFAGAIQGYPWLLFWSFLGIRNSFGKTRQYRENAALNYKFLKGKTAYISKRKLRECASRCFENVIFAEKYHIRHSYGRARLLYPLITVLPPVASLYSSFHMRVLFCVK